MIMQNKLFDILEDLNNCESKSLSDNITDRLDKVLNLYLEKLDKSYDNVLNYDLLKVLKELGK